MHPSDHGARRTKQHPMPGICPRRWPPDHRTKSRFVRTRGSHEAIAAAKAGIIGLTLAAAASYAGNQLRVNAVLRVLPKRR